MDKLVKELDTMCTLLSWKNSDDLHEQTLDFLIDEAEWAVCNLEVELEDGIPLTKFWAEKARVLHATLKKLCKKYALDYTKETPYASKHD